MNPITDCVKINILQQKLEDVSSFLLTVCKEVKHLRDENENLTIKNKELNTDINNFILAKDVYQSEITDLQIEIDEIQNVNINLNAIIKKLKEMLIQSFEISNLKTDILLKAFKNNKTEDLLNLEPFLKNDNATIKTTTL